MDLIDRQTALDALDKHCDVVCQYSKKQRSVMCGACTLGTAFDVIEGLPSIGRTRLEKAIAGKSAEEVYELLYKLMFEYARGYTDSRVAIIEWLKGEQDG